MSPIIKRRGEEFTLPSKYLLFILTVLCSALILITFNTNLFSGPLNSFAGVFVVPFQKGITKVGTHIKNTTDRLESLMKTRSLKRRLMILPKKTHFFGRKNMSLRIFASFLNSKTSMLNIRWSVQRLSVVIRVTGINLLLSIKVPMTAFRLI